MSQLKQFRIGSLIKALRKQRNFSQAELGEKLGMSQNNISKMENDHVPVTYEHLCIMCIVFDAPPTFFFQCKPFNNVNTNGG